MPCWEINLMTMEFIAKNIEYLKAAVEALNWKWQEEGNRFYVTTNYDSFTIDLANSTIELRRGNQGVVNQLKRKYSSKVIESLAKKRRWVMNQKTETTGTLRRY